MKVKEIFKSLAKKDIFWLIIFFLGRFPAEFFVATWSCWSVLFIMTAWCALVINAEVYCADFLWKKLGWISDKGWIARIRNGFFWENSPNGRKIFQYFVKYEAILLVIISQTPFMGVLLGSSLYSITRPRFGKNFIALGVFLKFCYILLIEKIMILLK